MNNIVCSSHLLDSKDVPIVTRNVQVLRKVARAEDMKLIGILKQTTL